MSLDARSPARRPWGPPMTRPRHRDPRPLPAPGTANHWTRARRHPAARPRCRPGLGSGAGRTRDAGSRRRARCHHLLAQGVHPADPAVPGPVRLLHVRHGARAAGQPLPVPGPGARHRAPGRRARLQGSPVHARRPAGGQVARGPRLARPERLRRHALLRPGHGHPGAGGDRPAAASQPRRADLGRLPAAQAGRAVHGHDA
jgi:hypothetical protein